MGNWDNIEFQRLARVQGGFAFKSDDYQVEGALLVRIGNLQKGSISFQNSVYIDTSINSFSDFKLNNGDILIGLTGDLGKLAKIKKDDLPALLNQRVGRFLLSENTDSEFLYQLISSEYFQEKLKVYFEGGAQANISPKQIESVYVYTTKSKPEQTRIAQILSTADRAITQTEALIAKYQRIKTGLMQDLLTKGIDEHGNIRSEQTHRFKTEKGLRVPEEWEVYEIGEITDHVGSGVTPKGGSNVYEHEGILLIRSQNVLIGEFDLEDVAYITAEINDRMQRSQLQDLDVLLNITGASIGRSHFVPKDFPKSNVNQHVCALRIKNSSLGKSLFVSSFLNSYEGQKQIKRLLGASNREGLNYQQIREIKLSMPKIQEDSEYQKIYSALTSINTKIETLKNNLKKQKSLKTGLMQDLLSGKVRVYIKAETLVNP